MVSLVSGPDLEPQIAALGEAIFAEARAATPAIWDADFYTGKLIELAMDDENVRVALFRFVDVLPTLRNSSSVIEHLQEYFQPLAERIPGLTRWGLHMDPRSLPARAVAVLVRNEVRALAQRFILGETPTSSLSALRSIRRHGMAFTVDLLGETVVSESEAQSYLTRYLELIHTLHAEVPHWSESQPLVPGHPGETTPLNISVKLSALYAHTNPMNTDHAVAVLAQRLTEIVREARRHDCFVYVDMENSPLTSITIETCKQVFGSPEFRDDAQVGMVFQAYLRRTEHDLRELIDWLGQRGTPMGVRLTKGAYWDTETIEAQLANWPVPVWQEKAASDFAFERLSRLLLDSSPLVVPGFASHNIRSLCAAIAYAESVGLDPTTYELQMLYGMADPIKQPFVRRGYLLREYAPIGELIPGMGYLVRRLLENTANQGFVRQGFREHETADALLAPPRPTTMEPEPRPGADPQREFRNTPLRDFSIPENRQAVRRALEQLAAPVRVHPVVGGSELESGNYVVNADPGDRDRALVQVHLASLAQAEGALQALRAYFPTWRATPAADRIDILFRTAVLLEQRRAELTAVIVEETGKPWAEADADVAEAIDFLHYYGLQAGELFQPRTMGRLAGEVNSYFYEPRGVCVVIGPWNFPLAIPCGMLSAALVTGNCVALKPSTQSAWIASYLYRTFLEAGLPPEAAAFLPASGGEVGTHLVTSPHTSTIVFTGSKDVGLRILTNAASVSPGQEQVKRVIAEMGSKNAIIVDADADLDLAVKGVIQSAFGYAGQKCSACSRVIVLREVYDRFAERLGAAVASLPVGLSTDPSTLVGPVISIEAQARLQAVIQEAKHSCHLVAEGVLPPAAERGNFVAPIVFDEIPPGHELLTRELFGPILAMIRAPDFDAAIRIALDTEYGLTGAVYSRSPRHLEQAIREFRVGNLYLNRPSTGALVERQPFGGARMSGTGSKAGGPDYLPQFVIPRSVSESTLRKGFAPLRG